MKSFKIPVIYKVFGTVEVEAETLEDAIQYADKHIKDLELPTNGEYIEDSYEICDDDISYIEQLNK